MDHHPISCSNAVGGSFVEIGIAIGIGIEIEMVLGHEKLDVYGLSIGYVAWDAESRQRKGELDHIAAMLTTYLKIMIGSSGMGLDR